MKPEEKKLRAYWAVSYVDTNYRLIHTSPVVKNNAVPSWPVPRVGEEVSFSTHVDDKAARKMWNVENDFPPEELIWDRVIAVKHNTNITLLPFYRSSLGETYTEITRIQVVIDFEYPLPKSWLKARGHEEPKNKPKN